MLTHYEGFSSFVIRSLTHVISSVTIKLKITSFIIYTFYYGNNAHEGANQSLSTE